jgi:hypothetical protein
LQKQADAVIAEQADQLRRDEIVREREEHEILQRKKLE